MDNKKTLVPMRGHGYHLEGHSASNSPQLGKVKSHLEKIALAFEDLFLPGSHLNGYNIIVNFPVVAFAATMCPI